jgi:hypothetical protein
MTFRVFVFFALAFLACTSREPPWADAHVTYDTTQALVDRWDLDVHTEGGPPWLYAHRLGRKYGVFPLGNVVAMVPSYLAYKLLHGFELAPERVIFAFTSHLSPALLMAGVMALLFHLLRKRGATTRWALLGTFATGLCTFCLIYARATYSEALQAMLMLWLVERTLDQAEGVTMAGLGWLAMAAGLLINSKLVYVLLLPFVAIYVIDRRRRVNDLAPLWRALPLASLVFIEMTALALWHNHLKTGSVWDSGYQIKDGVFSGDLFAGLYGFLLSTGKSAFLYSPPLVLGLLGLRTALARRRAETLFLLALCVVTLLFNAKFRHWHADYCWGPRHLVAITPIVMLLAFPWLPEAIGRGRRWLRQSALGILLGLGLSVQLLGAAFYWDHYIRMLIAVKDQTGASGWFQENLSHGHYVPEFSPLRGHVWMLRHWWRDDPDLDRDAPWKTVLPLPADLSDGWRRLRLDWWALDWTDPQGKRSKAGWATLALLEGGAFVLLFEIARKTRKESERDQKRELLAGA